MNRGVRIGRDVSVYLFPDGHVRWGAARFPEVLNSLPAEGDDPIIAYGGSTPTSDRGTDFLIVPENDADLLR
jgi:hypothetical protein